MATPKDRDTYRLPWPPTANLYYRRVGNKTLISKGGRDYRARVISELSKSLIYDGRLAVSINAFPPDRRRRDLDNMLKPLLDAIQHAGTYKDDSQIDHLTIVRQRVESGGYVEVTITELEQP